MYSLYKLKEEEELVKESKDLNDFFPILKKVLKQNRQKMIRTFLNDRGEIIIDFGFFSVFFIIRIDEGKIKEDIYKEFDHKLEEYCFEGK